MSPAPSTVYDRLSEDPMLDPGHLVGGGKMNTLSVLVEALFAEPAWFSVIGLGLDVVAVAAITWDLVISGRPVDGAGMPGLAGATASPPRLG